MEALSSLELHPSFEAIEEIEGWLSRGEFFVFGAILAYQNVVGVQGDILEIGVYHGRSAAAEAAFLKDQEHLVLVDTFRWDEIDGVWDNIHRVVPDLARDRVEFMQMRSQDLTFTEPRFRFIYVDGGHTFLETTADLALASDVLLPGGVIVVDDYDDADWPEVKTAVDGFLARGDFRVMLDPKVEVSQRKLYLVRP